MQVTPAKLPHLFRSNQTGVIEPIVLFYLEDALDRTNFLATWNVEVSNTFNAGSRVDHIDFGAFGYGRCRALRFARTAIDAIFIDIKSHFVLQTIESLP